MLCKRLEAKLKIEKPCISRKTKNRTTNSLIQNELTNFKLDLEISNWVFVDICYPAQYPNALLLEF